MSASKLRGMADTRKRAPASDRRSASRSPRSSKAARPRARRRSRGSAGLLAKPFRSLPRAPVLEQRERDVLGLALLAAGVFMGFVLYGGWNGGHAGHGLAVALGWTLGRARVLAPVALALAGGALLARPVLPAMRPLRSGALCVFASVTLALAAGTLGLSSGPAGRGGPWARPSCRPTAACWARRCMSPRIASCRASAWTSSSSS